jgi:hypothetical protein
VGIGESGEEMDRNDHGSARTGRRIEDDNHVVSHCNTAPFVYKATSHRNTIRYVTRDTLREPQALS